ncbi:hypothetical protein Tco_0472585 [Tanacetum coccineum]
MKIHHAGKFKEHDKWRYANGLVTYVDGFDIDEFLVHELNDVMKELGYINDDPIYYHYMIPGTDLDIGLRALGNDLDVQEAVLLLKSFTVLVSFPTHPKKGVNKNSSKRLLLEYPKPSPTPTVTPTPIVNPTPNLIPVVNPTPTVTPTPNVTSTPHPTPTVTPTPNLTLTLTQTHTLNANPSPSKKKYTKNSANKGKTIVTELDTSEPETLPANVNASEPENVAAFVNTSEPETPPSNVNFDPFEDNVTASMNEQPSFNKQPRLDDSGSDEDDSNYIVDEDTNLEEVNVKNLLQKPSKDKGKKVVGPSVLVGPTKKVVSSSGKGRPKPLADDECPWALQISKVNKSKTWEVRTYADEHKCLQSREMHACNSKLLAKGIIKAKSAAINQVKGDYRQQYSMLRDYCLELRRVNPDTTIKIEVERDSYHELQTRVFKKIYICLGPLKKGFKAGEKDLLGLDGAFMKGPYPDQLLTIIGLDGNNGAIMEKETISSWTWFLECLGYDLGMSRESNYTFISDRQKVSYLHWLRCATATIVPYFDKATKELKYFNSDAFEWLLKKLAHTWSRFHFSGHNNRSCKGKKEPVNEIGTCTSQRPSNAATRKRPSNAANDGNGVTPLKYGSKKISELSWTGRWCMTRSSTKELFTPFKTSERVFHSKRRLFETPGLVESSSPEFDLFSNIEEHSEEEATSIMTETMEQYMSKTHGNYGGSEHEDANEHIEKVLEIVDLFHIPEVTQDQIMLRAFIMSLTGSASHWLRNEPSGSITNWETLKSKFLNKYCLPTRTAKKMEEINNFQQEPDERLFRAWEIFKELS